MSEVNIIQCPADQYAGYIQVLAALHRDCVYDGASMNFVLPLSLDDARVFWDRHASAVTEGNEIVFLAMANDATGLVGCVVLAHAWAPNAPHRAEVGKLMVHPTARGKYDPFPSYLSPLLYL
jgi:hypothetical protein